MNTLLDESVHVRLCAATGCARDAAIVEWLQTAARVDPGRRIVVAEGELFDRQGPHDVPVLGLAAGCPCCAGLPTLRVLLTRALRRHRPRALLLLLSSDRHLPRVRELFAGGELGLRFEVDQC